MDAKIHSHFEDAFSLYKEGVVLTGDPSSYKGYYVNSAFSVICGTLGNTVFSYNMDARTGQEKKQDLEERKET
tara:strand:- start:680 stop:898 length:219 start_codon:yes stop_codon:yes gene_type:complete